MMNFMEAVAKKKENLNNDVYRYCKPEYTLSCEMTWYHRTRDEVINLVFDDIEADDWQVVEDDWSLAKHKWSKFSRTAWKKGERFSPETEFKKNELLEKEDVKKCRDLILEDVHDIVVERIINKRFGDL